MQATVVVSRGWLKTGGGSPHVSPRRQPGGVGRGAGIYILRGVIALNVELLASLRTSVEVYVVVLLLDDDVRRGTPMLRVSSNCGD